MPSPTLGFSTWTFHRLLGRPAINSPAAPEPPNVDDAQWPSLLQAAHDFGFRRLDICHFHLSSREPAKLNEFAARLRETGLQPHALLMDTGDLSTGNPTDLDWAKQWLRDAARLGCECMRVPGGLSPFNEDAFTRSLDAFRLLIPIAEDTGIALITENWLPLLRRAEHIDRFLDALEGRVGFLLDLGNLVPEDRYAELEQLAPLAQACHAKANFLDDQQPDQADFQRCLDCLRRHDFDGPLTFIGDEADLSGWPHLTWMKTQVRQAWQAAS